MNNLIFFAFNKIYFINIPEKINIQFKIINLKKTSYYLDLKISIKVEKKVLL